MKTAVCDLLSIEVRVMEAAMGGGAGPRLAAAITLCPIGTIARYGNSGTIAELLHHLTMVTDNSIDLRLS